MRKKIDTIGNLASYIGFCCVGFFVIYLSLSMKAASALFPILLSLILIVFNMSLIAKQCLGKKSNKDKQVFNRKKGKEKGNFTKKQSLKYEIYPFIVILFCLFFIVGFQKIGFDISAFLLTFVTMVIINPKEGFRKFYIALLVPFLLILLFKSGLNLRIPLLIERLLG